MEIVDYIDRKGMGTTDLFDVIPVGKKGTSYIRTTKDGSKLVTAFNDNVRDAEIKVAIALLSHTIQSLGKKEIDSIRDGFGLETITDDGQAVYSDTIIVDAKDLSELLNRGDRTKGKRAFTALKHLENMTMTYSYDGCKNESVIRLFQGVAYKNGKIAFNVANFLINRLEKTFTSFRIKPVLAQIGQAMRLSVYVETHQKPMGKYKDDGGVMRTKYVAKNEYSLEELVNGLRLGGHRPNDIVVQLQESFDELHNSDINPIPKFTYNKRRKVFENEYKNGNRD